MLGAVNGQFLRNFFGGLTAVGEWIKSISDSFFSPLRDFKLLYVVISIFVFMTFVDMAVSVILTFLEGDFSIGSFTSNLNPYKQFSYFSASSFRSNRAGKAPMSFDNRLDGRFFVPNSGLARSAGRSFRRFQSNRKKEKLRQAEIERLLQIEKAKQEQLDWFQSHYDISDEAYGKLQADYIKKKVEDSYKRDFYGRNIGQNYFNYHVLKAYGLKYKHNPEGEQKDYNYDSKEV